MNIIELAREAGFKDPTPADGYMGNAYDYRDGKDSGGSLTRFAALVRTAALEEAAGVCEEVHDRYPTDISPDGASVDAQSAKMARITATNCAAAIRAMKEQT